MPTAKYTLPGACGRCKILHMPTTKYTAPESTQLTSAQSRAAVAAYLKAHPIAGGFDNVDDFAWTYLVPFALRRLEALAKYKRANPRKASKAKPGKVRE